MTSILFTQSDNFSAAYAPSVWGALNPVKHAPNPPMYENNGGTVLAVAGSNFVAIAADSRLSKDFHILSRDISRLWEISPGVWMSAAGCWSDALALVDILHAEAEKFNVDHGYFPNVEVTK